MLWSQAKPKRIFLKSVWVVLGTQNLAGLFFSTWAGLQRSDPGLPNSATQIYSTPLSEFGRLPYVKGQQLESFLDPQAMLL